jgi:hypothetical protein
VSRQKKDRAPLRGIKSHFHQSLGVPEEDFFLVGGPQSFRGMAGLLDKPKEDQANRSRIRTAVEGAAHLRRVHEESATALV